MPTVLYAYDPLDRLIQTAGIRRFYNRSRMTTEIEGTVQRSVFQVGDHVLAEGGSGGSNLLATDLQRSVLHTVNPDKTQPIAYSVYGHRPADSGVASVLGFNGERADPVTGHYLLGNGYRAFNPVLMRFNSPDSMSPFGQGGINAYGYCAGDPLNFGDSSGHFFQAINRSLKNMKTAVADFFLGTKSAEISNIRKLADGIVAFERVSKSGYKKLVLGGHGGRLGGKTVVAAGNIPLSSKGLVTLARDAGVDFRDYKAVDLIICTSANLGFAQDVANLTRLPAKGFNGPVTAMLPDEWIPDMVVGEIYQSSTPMRIFRNDRGIYKLSPMDFALRNYKPVKFMPQNVNSIRATN
ncbi:RHS repeat-associated core domain-containing protein [Pseudomonas sp. PS01297]|uniref:RHS repeat-associated core domain-containing protein n=1 Tax=Pseudomonas sp. PS01297 TaxID=2991433 RepID=UPI00249A803D|nr:RHS repeat-associated core domain-containing protein [Pseudomonas sp. PS01297]